jgi:hypothetical protein
MHQSSEFTRTQRPCFACGPRISAIIVPFALAMSVLFLGFFLPPIRRFDAGVRPISDRCGDGSLSCALSFARELTTVAVSEQRLLRRRGEP